MLKVTVEDRMNGKPLVKSVDIYDERCRLRSTQYCFTCVIKEAAMKVVPFI